MVGRTSFEDLRVYQLAASLSDEVWRLVAGWDKFSQSTVGQQLVRAVDSVGANIAEGCGRYSLVDNRRFVRIARGSLYETKYWIQRATERHLVSVSQKEKLDNQINTLLPTLNAYLKSLNQRIN